MNETAPCILPCPSYDMEAVESWLTDQAKQGWYLERQGDYFGRFHFRKDVPRALPYRLVSSLESTTVLQRDPHPWVSSSPRRSWIWPPIPAGNTSR